MKSETAGFVTGTLAIVSRLTSDVSRPCKGRLFPVPENNGKMTLEEESFLIVVHHLWDLRRIGIEAHADFQRLDGFVEAAKIKTEGSFQKETGFHL